MVADDSGNRHQRISTFLGWNTDRGAFQTSENPKSDCCPVNEIKRPEDLNRRGWSVVRKAQVIGAAAGASMTIAVPLILKAYGNGPDTFLLVLCWAVVLGPAGGICKLFGWEWQILISKGPSWVQTVLAILTNAFLLFLVGTLIGWIVGKFKKPQREN